MNFIRNCQIVLTIVTIYFFYKIWVMFTVIPRYCWKADHFWQQSELSGPYWMFLFTFLVVGIWIFSEFVLAQKGRRVLTFSVAIISYCFLIPLAVNLFTLKEMLQIENGTLTKEEYTFKTSILDVKPIEFPSLHDFDYYQYTCEKGWDPYGLTQEQSKHIDDIYEQLADNT